MSCLLMIAQEERLIMITSVVQLSPRDTIRGQQSSRQRSLLQVEFGFEQTWAHYRRPPAANLPARGLEASEKEKVH